MSTSARAAKVHHVFTPLISQPPSTARGGRDHRGHVGAEVGLGDGHRVHDLAARPAWAASCCFCSSVPPRHEGAAQDLGPGDERSARARASPTTAPRWRPPCRGSRSRPRRRSPPYSSGIDRPRAPISARPAMISSGMSPLARWMCSARGRICSSAKRWKVSRTSSKSASRWRSPSRAGQAGQERRVAVGGRRRRGRGRASRGSTPKASSRPTVRATRSARASATKAQAMRASSCPARRTSRAARAVAHAGRGVGQVVGHDLVGVGPAGGRQPAGGAVDDHRRATVDGGGGGRADRVRRGDAVTARRGYRPLRGARARARSR